MQAYVRGVIIVDASTLRCCEELYGNNVTFNEYIRQGWLEKSLRRGEAILHNPKTSVWDLIGSVCTQS